MMSDTNFKSEGERKKGRSSFPLPLYQCARERPVKRILAFLLNKIRSQGRQLRRILIAFHCRKPVKFLFDVVQTSGLLSYTAQYEMQLSKKEFNPGG